MRNPNRLVGVVLLVVMSLGVVWWAYLDSRSGGSRSDASLLPLPPASQGTKAASGSKPSAAAPALGAIGVTDIDSVRKVISAPHPKSAIDTFKDWASTYAHADIAHREHLMKEGRELAVARHHEMSGLIESNPREFLRRTLPFELREQLPEEIKAGIETSENGLAQFKTTFAVHDTEQQGRFVRPVEVNGQTYEATFAGVPVVPSRGISVPVNGVALGGHLVLSSDPVRILSAGEVATLKAQGALPTHPTCVSTGESVDNPASWGQVGGKYYALCGQEDAIVLSQQAQAASRSAVQLAGFDSGETQIPAAPQVRQSKGQFRILVARFRFPGDPSMPLEEWDTTQFSDRAASILNSWSYGNCEVVPIVTPVVMLSQARQWYAEWFRGADNRIFIGGFFGFFDTNQPPGRFESLRLDAAKALRDAGYDVDSYDHIQAVFPPIPASSASAHNVFTQNPGSWAVSTGNMQGIFASNPYTGKSTNAPTGNQVNAAFTVNVHAMLSTMGRAFGIQPSTLCDTRSPFRDSFPVIPLLLRTPPPHILETEWWYGQEGYNRSGIYVDPTVAIAFERGSDPFDIMGGSTPYANDQAQFSVVHKMILGWLPTNYVRVVDESTTNRLYAFDVPSLSPGNIYALGVRKDVLRTNWLEYRRRITDNPWISRGVLMHWGPWEGANSLSQLIDSTPGSKAGNEGFEDAAVLLGRTFSDPVSGHHITPTARGVDSTGEWMDIVVQKGQFKGNRAPTFNLSVSAFNVRSNDVVTFKAMNVLDPDGDQVSYFWDFGDRTFGENLPEVKKAFLPGQYVVRCEVSDMKGGMLSTHVVITVDGVSTTRVHGLVIDLDRKPLANVRVAAIGPNDAVGFTDSDGLYDIVNIPAGTVTNIAHLYGYKILPRNFKNDSPLQNNASAELNYLAIAKTSVSVESLGDLDLSNRVTSAFRFTRDGNISQPLIVKYRVDGDAVTNLDYTGPIPPTNQIVFGPGVGQIDLPVQALSNPFGGGERTIVLSLALDINQVVLRKVPLQDGSFVTLEENNRVPFYWDDILFPGNPGTWGWLQTDSPYILGQGEARIRVRDTAAEARPLVSLKTISDLANENGYDAAQIIFGLERPSTRDITVRYSLSGKARFGVDFAPVAGEITIPAGVPMAVLPIFAIPNRLVEGTRDLTVSIEDAPDFDVGVSRATIYILDDDLPDVRVSATLDTIFESDQNSGVFRITRSGDLSEPLAVDYVFSGTATNGIDFVSVPGTLIIPAGSDRDFVNITPIPDGKQNLAKTVTLELSSSPRYNAGNRSRSTVTILDDVSPSVGILPAADGATSAAEGTPGFSFQVVRLGSTNDTIFVNYEVGGTAENGADYRSIGTTVVIPAGQRAVQIPIVPIADRINEWNETVVLRLLPNASYQIDPRFPEVTGTILDVDGQGLLASVGFELESSTVRESDGLLTVGVHLTGAPQLQNTPLVVEYRVVSGSAVLGKDYDFLSNDRVSATGWLRYAFFGIPETIATIDLTRNINIVLKDNPDKEPLRNLVLELVYPQLNNGTNSPIFSVPGIQATNYILTTRRFHWITILDDDAFQLSVEAVKPLAYERGVQPGAFRIFRTGTNSMEEPQSVRFDISGTATEYADFKALPRIVTIPARARDVIVQVDPVDDLVYEGPETVTMTLVHADGSTIGTNNRATITIVDDDGTIEFTAREFHVSEAAGTASIPVRRVGDTSLSQFVKYSIKPGTATFDSDYFATDGRLDFAPGETLKTIDFLVFNDTIPELPETIELTLGDPSGAVSLAGQNRTTVIIDSDDTGFVFTTNQWSGAEFGGPIEVSVQRVGSLEGEASVRLRTSIGIDDRATSGTDFEVLDTRLVFADGESLKTARVTPIEDQLVEGDESLTLTLSEPQGGDVSPETATAKVLIRDDDCSVDFTVASYQILEHRRLVTLTLRRLGGTLNTVSVDFATTNGTALAGKDYIATNGTVTFIGEQIVAQTNGTGGTIVIPGQTNATVDILIIDDTIGEASETFTVNLSHILTLSPGRSPQAAVLGTNTVATVTIIDNELPGHIDNEYGPKLAFTQREGTNGDSRSAAVNAIVTLPNGRAVIGGEFTEINDYTFRRVARLTLEGDLDLGFNPGVGTDGSVLAMATTDDGRIFVAGEFKQAQGQDRPGIALLSADGDLERSFDPGIGSEGVPVRAVAVQTDGYVVVGGDFTRFDGQTRLRLARLDAKGFIDPTFGPSADGKVSALAIQSDGKILIGGSFSNISATASSGLARLNPDGTIDPSFVIGKGIKGSTLAVAVQPDGKILVGGQFTAFDTVSVTNLVRLNSDGSFDNSFNQGSGPNDVVRALGVHRLGKIYVGGSFTSFNGEKRNRFLRLRSDGSLDAQFDVGTGADATVRALNVAASSAVYIGGEFSTVDGEARPRFARIHGDEKLSLVGVEFVNSSITVGEDVGSVTLTVRRVGDPSFPFTVDFHTVPALSTATAGSDYVATNGTFSFPAGVLTRSFKVQIIDDLIGEPTETINYVLDNAPFGVDLGGGVTSVIRILDNEATVGIASKSISVPEAGTNVIVVLTRKGNTNAAAAVTVNITSGTAIAGQDFDGTSIPVSFAPQEDRKEVKIPIYNDNLQEGNETFSVNLVNPSAGLLIANGSATVTIIDDDFDKIIYIGSALIADANSNGVIDAGEETTVNVALRNVGSADTTNLVATLRNAGFVTPTGSGIQTYGPMIGGGNPVTKAFTFKNTAVEGQSLSLTLDLKDGNRSLGSVGFTLTVGRQTITFSNTNLIVINDHDIANPYPSEIRVSGVVGSLVKVVLTIDGLQHEAPDDIDMMLIAPSGMASTFFSDLGGSSRNPVKGLVITLDDESNNILPRGTDGVLTSGTFHPRNSGGGDQFDPPAPLTAAKDDLEFGPIDPNGTWSLYIKDDGAGNSGHIDNGWRITLFTSGRQVPTTDLAVSLLESSDPVVIGQTLTYTLRVQNNGPAPATGVVLTQNLPANAEFVSVSAGATFGANKISSAIPVLEVGAVREFTVVVRPTAVGQLVSSAGATSVEADLVKENNTATATTVVSPLAPAPVPLTVQSIGGELVKISWPAVGTGVLEATMDPVSTPWVAVHTQPTLAGDHYEVTLSSGNHCRFYRLR